MGLKGDPLQRRQIWDQGIKDTNSVQPGYNQVSKAAPITSCVNTPKQHWRVLRTTAGHTQATQLEEIKEVFMSQEKLKPHQETYKVTGALHQIKIRRKVDPEVIQQGQVLISINILIGTGNPGPEMEG